MDVFRVSDNAHIMVGILGDMPHPSSRCTIEWLFSARELGKKYKKLLVLYRVVRTRKDLAEEYMIIRGW